MLLQRARHEGRVSEALMEANVVAPAQLPLRPGMKAKAKAKPKARSGYRLGSTDGESSAVGGGAMTDASKRLAPDDGFLDEELQEELFDLPEEFLGSDGFSVIEEPMIRDFMGFHEATIPPTMSPAPVLGMGYLSYDNIDERIALPQGVESTRAWGATEIQMPKFKGVHTFETLAKTALGGDKEAIKYCAFIKTKYLAAYTVTPSSQGPDLAGFLQRIFWEPPVPEPQSYVRTLRTTG